MKKIVKVTIVAVPVVAIVAVSLVWFFIMRPASSAKNTSNSSIEALVNSGCSKENVSVLEQNYNKLTDASVKASSADTIAQCYSADIANLDTTLVWSKKAEESYRDADNTTKADQYKNYIAQIEQIKSSASIPVADQATEKGVE